MFFYACRNDFLIALNFEIWQPNELEKVTKGSMAVVAQNKSPFETEIKLSLVIDHA